MSFFEKHRIKKMLGVTAWVLLGAAVIVLMVVAFNKNNALACSGVEVEIEGNSNHFFIDKNDVTEVITNISGKKIVGKNISDFDLKKMETALKKDPWIKKSELFFNKDGKLIVRIEEKEPLARVFCMNGNSFYIDQKLNMLPLSNRHSARLPVFTNFPVDLRVLSKEDSSLLNDVRTIATMITKDSFLMAMVDQVAISAQRKFEIVPKIGDQLIKFGDASFADEKFNKLKLFYNKVIVNDGLRKYRNVDLQYKSQIVATVRDAKDVIQDSLKTLQLIKMIATLTEQKAADTTVGMVPDNDKNTVDVSFINQSIQREEMEDKNASLPAEKTDKPVNDNNSKTGDKKNINNKKQQKENSDKKSAAVKDAKRIVKKRAKSTDKNH